MARCLYIKTAKPMRHWLRTNIEIKPDTKWIASLVSGIFNDKQGKYIVWIEYNIQWGITTVIHRTLTAWSWGRHAKAPYTHIDYQLLSVCSVISMLVCTNYYIYVKLYYTLPSSMKNRHIFTKLDVRNWRFGCSEWLLSLAILLWAAASVYIHVSASANCDSFGTFLSGIWPDEAVVQLITNYH